MNNEEWNDGFPGVGVMCTWHQNKGDKKGKECVIEWTDGEWFTVRNMNSFKTVQVIRNVIFRQIKKREPKPGEVYLNIGGNPCVFRDTTDRFKLVCLDGSDSFPMRACMEYAAPSVKSYYARELLADAKHKTETSGQAINTEGWEPLKQAARLDEE